MGDWGGINSKCCQKQRRLMLLLLLMLLLMLMLVDHKQVERFFEERQRARSSFSNQLIWFLVKLTKRQRSVRRKKEWLVFPSHTHTHTHTRAHTNARTHALSLALFLSLALSISLPSVQTYLRKVGHYMKWTEEDLDDQTGRSNEDFPDL